MKTQSFLSHVLFAKKKHNHNSHSQDNSLTTSSNKITSYNTKGAKLKSNLSKHKQLDIKVNSSVLDNKRFSAHNYINHNKPKSQNHSLNHDLSSDKLLIHLSNRRQFNNNKCYSQSNNNNLSVNHTQTNVNKQSKATENKLTSTPIAFGQSFTGYVAPHNSYYRTMKQKIMYSTIDQDNKEKQAFNVSYQKTNGNSKKKTADRNKTFNNYEDEWNGKPSHNNINITDHVSLGERLKNIENQLDEGLGKLKTLKDGQLITNAKSYNVYKLAFEEMVKEMPSDYQRVARKVINGYHQIVSTFISEQRSLIEHYDELELSKVI